jgi:acyl-CoA synthetase (AMP-forming)/AMP-acid ligase II
MFAVAVGWQVYALTGSALALGLIGLVQFVPMVLLTLIAGHVADRYDRRLVIAVCQAAEGLAVAALALGTLGGALDEAGILAALREGIDPVFLPRPLRLVAALPRNATGKLPRDALLAALRDPGA